MDLGIKGRSAIVGSRGSVLDLALVCPMQSQELTLVSCSRAAYRMGAVGSGAMTKLIINLILFGNRLALAEGLVLGMKAGMAGESLLRVLQDAACSSKTMVDKGPKMLNGEYSTALRLSRMSPLGRYGELSITILMYSADLCTVGEISACRNGVSKGTQPILVDR